MKPSAPRYAADELVCSSNEVAESGTAGPRLSEIKESMVLTGVLMKPTSVLRCLSMSPPQVKLRTWSEGLLCS